MTCASVEVVRATPSSKAEREHLREQRLDADASVAGHHALHEEVADVDVDDDVGRSYQALDVSVSSMTNASSQSVRSLFVRDALLGLPNTLVQAVAAYDAMCRSLVDRRSCSPSRSLGLLESGYIAARSVAPVSQVRLLRYPATAKGGLNAHTDYELASVCVASAPGLEVYDGESWLELDLSVQQACLMVGDLMEVASGGRVRAALHRVKTTNVARASAVYFAGLDYDRTVADSRGSRVANSQRLPVHVGEHLGAMTIRNYRHLQERVLEGGLYCTSAVPGSNPLRTDVGSDGPLIPCKDFRYY